MTAVISPGNKPTKLVRISLANCMSWRSGAIDLHPGLNVVVGPSDSGKTNVYRAVRAVVENCPAKDLLSIGSQEGSASIEFAGGTAVSLSKGVGKSSCNEYEVGQSGKSPQRYQQVGADCPPPVADVLRLGPVDLSGVEADLHFSPQRGPMFGVDAKPGDLAKMIGAVSGLDVVYRGLAQAETNRKSAQTEADRSEAVFTEARDKFRTAEAAFSRADSAKLRESLASASQAHIDESDRARELFLAATQCEQLLADVELMEGPVAAAMKLIDAAEVKLKERQAQQVIARDLIDQASRIESAIAAANFANLNLTTKTTILKDVEDRVHKIVGVECPLCQRKGKP